MKTEFKIGDRVKVTAAPNHPIEENILNRVGTIVAIDSDGDPLLKFDEEPGGCFRTCEFNQYVSDKADLLNIEGPLEIELV